MRAPRRADRQADADFTLTRHAARQQQVRDVRAANQQDQAEGDEQRRKHHERLHRLRHGAAPRHQVDRWRAVTGLGRGAVCHPRDELRARAATGISGFDAADDVDAGAVFASALPGPELWQLFERCPAIRRADRQASEAGRHHADDFKRHAADQHGAAEHAGVTIEATLPSSIAQHHDGVAAAFGIVGGCQRASPGGAHTHHVKEVARDERHRHDAAFDAEIDIGNCGVHVGEDGRLTSHRVELGARMQRQDIVLDARVARRRRTGRCRARDRRETGRC